MLQTAAALQASLRANQMSKLGRDTPCGKPHEDMRCALGEASKSVCEPINKCAFALRARAHLV